MTHFYNLNSKNLVLNPQYFLYDSCLTSYHFLIKIYECCRKKVSFWTLLAVKRIKKKKTNAMQQVGLIKDTLSVEPDTQKITWQLVSGRNFNRSSFN